MAIKRKLPLIEYNFHSMAILV